MKNPTRRSSFLRRCFAAALDFLIAGVLGGAVVAVIYKEQFLSGTLLKELSESALEAPQLHNMLLLMVSLNLLYYIPEITHGISPGKWLAGLRIACIEAESLKTRLFRYLTKHCVGILHVITALFSSNLAESVGMFLSLVLFAGFFLALRKSRLALHDFISGTEVAVLSKK